jgi:hypothetical protein
MLRRLYDLEVLPKWAYESSYRQLSARGWRVKEPDSLPREQSYTHGYVLTRLREVGQSIADLANECALSSSDILELMPVGNQIEPFRQLPTSNGDWLLSLN